MVLISHCAYTQSYDNNWVFGDSIGLNFSTGEPVFYKTGIYESSEACASISDTEGNLIFYTNGNKVWDRNNNVMPDGEGLEIGSYYSIYGSSLTQGVLIAPFPGADSLFYIIYLSRNDGWVTSYGLKYSVVNINLNGGLGDVLEKNILISSDTLTEKLQLVKHGNGRDWWLIALTKVEEAGKLSRFVKFLITPAGIEGPYYQDYAEVYHTYEGIFQNQDYGYMKFSQQGDKVCVAKGRDADVYNFDRCSGEFSNYVSIHNIVQEWDLINIVYGIAYSLNGRYLYIATYDYAAMLSRPFLYQFCTTCPEPIEDTKTLICAPDTGSLFWPISLAPNGKIYIGRYSVDKPDDSILCVINFPETGGLACDFDTIAISTTGITLPKLFGLPNMPNYNLGPLAGSDCDTLVAINESPRPSGIKIYPNPASDHIFIEGGLAFTSGVIDLHLYNVFGEEVFTRENISINTNIPLPDLSNGLYAVLLMDDDQLILADKVIIKH